jgi:hypothetical protein
MYMRVIRTIKASFNLALLCVTFAGVKTSAQSGSTSVRVKPDVDCVVAIDGHVVARVGAEKEESFPLRAGRHTLAAATIEGDYWEKQVEVTAQPGSLVDIPLQKARSDRQSFANEISILRAEVEDKKKELGVILNQNQMSVDNAEAVRKERQLIVQAIDHYSKYYGKELGLRDDLHETAKQLAFVAATPSQNPSGMTNVEAWTKAAEYTFAGLSWLAGHRHEAAARRIKDRMHELEKALKDPMQNPRVAGQEDYLTSVRPVTKKGLQGQVITSPGLVEFRDSNEDTKLSCKEQPKASGGRKVTIHYLEWDKQKPKKHHGKTIHLKARNKKEGKLLTTDVLLACPRE